MRRSDLTRYFKPERFGVTGKVLRTERPRAGVRILRDRWGVPHVYGRTRADVEFGAGYATAEDRYVLMELLRGPGRLAALDVPGLNPLALARSGRQFVPTREADARIARQLALIRSAGKRGKQMFADVRSYVAGINAYYRQRNQGLRPWTTTDVIAVGALLGAGTGEYEWRGFEPLRRHVRGVNPKSGVLLSWNNKPGRGFSASDDNWVFGPVQRVQLDRDLDGKIDDPGAAIMDAAWPRIADGVMRPRLGPLTDRLETLVGVDDPANPTGSSYYVGWYSYVYRELLAATPTFCGGGDREQCRASLWATIDTAGSQLAAAQGPDPARWRADATRERLTFGFLPKTARWTNRPTFQQVLTFASHRRR